MHMQRPIQETPRESSPARGFVERLIVNLALGFICPALLCLPRASHAAARSGILNPERAADWSEAGISGGLPIRKTIFRTIAPGATADEINKAIASCPGGQVVLLGPGTYTLSTGIDFANHSDVTLRGAGADQTFLVFTGSVERHGIASDISIENFDANLPHLEDNYPGAPSNTAEWTDGYSQGATEVTLSSTANLVAGKSIVCLDQLDDSDTDTGSIWESQKKDVSANEGPGGSGRKGRAEMQISLVTGINGNKATITPGLFMPNWRSGQKPGAWWPSTVVSGDGIEDLSIDHSHSGAKSGILLFNAYRCWVKGIRDINSNRNHVWFFLAAHCVVRDSYFYGTQNAIYLSYGVEEFMGANNLVENNIFQHIVSPMITNGTGSGTVWGYNYAVDDYYADAYAKRTKIREWFMPANVLHAAGSEMILMEGNDSTGLIADFIHGTHHFITAFRNQFTGWEPGMKKQTIPVHLYTGSRYFNLVGNVLGKPGYHIRYEDVPPDGTDANFSIYSLGWAGNEGRVTSRLKNDPKVTETLMRWGNYDTVTKQAQWRASEVPSGLDRYANPVPAHHQLPASFYLSGKPSWWGTMPWPAIGPDVSGGTDPSGHVYANPAEVCYSRAPRDYSYPEDQSGNRVLVFNANRYYTASSTP
jgi:hypothetical protein